MVGSGCSGVWVIAQNAISALETTRKAIEGMKGRTISWERRTDRAMEALSLISAGVGFMKSILDCL